MFSTRQYRYTPVNAYFYRQALSTGADCFAFRLYKVRNPFKLTLRHFFHSLFYGDPLWTGRRCIIAQRWRYPFSLRKGYRYHLADDQNRLLFRPSKTANFNASTAIQAASFVGY